MGSGGGGEKSKNYTNAASMVLAHRSCSEFWVLFWLLAPFFLSPRLLATFLCGVLGPCLVCPPYLSPDPSSPPACPAMQARTHHSHPSAFCCPSGLWRTEWGGGNGLWSQATWFSIPAWRYPSLVPPCLTYPTCKVGMMMTIVPQKRIF